MKKNKYGSRNELSCRSNYDFQSVYEIIRLIAIGLSLAIYSTQSFGAPVPAPMKNENPGEDHKRPPAEGLKWACSVSGTCRPQGETGLIPPPMMCHATGKIKDERGNDTQENGDVVLERALGHYKNDKNKYNCTEPVVFSCIEVLKAAPAREGCNVPRGKPMPQNTEAQAGDGKSPKKGKSPQTGYAWLCELSMECRARKGGGIEDIYCRFSSWNDDPKSTDVAARDYLKYEVGEWRDEHEHGFGSTPPDYQDCNPLWPSCREIIPPSDEVDRDVGCHSRGPKIKTNTTNNPATIGPAKPEKPNNTVPPAFYRGGVGTECEVYGNCPNTERVAPR